MARNMVSNYVDWVTNTVTLSAHAITAVPRVRWPIVIPYTLPSNMERRGGDSA